MIEIGNGYVRRSIKIDLFFSGLTAFRQRCVLCISYCTSVTESSAIIPLAGPLAIELITRNSSSHTLEKQFKGKFELAYLQNYKG